MAERKAEEYKGRAKEAAGDVTKDEDLKREGQADQGSARVKEKVDKAADKAKETLAKDDGDGNGGKR